MINFVANMIGNTTNDEYVCEVAAFETIDQKMCSELITFISSIPELQLSVIAPLL